MAFCNHSIEDSLPLRSRVNGAFSKVVSGDHEGSLCIIHQQLIKKIRCIIIWSIIERECNISIDNTIVDSSAAVWYVPNPRSRNARGRRASRNRVCITSRPIKELAVRSCTVIDSKSTPPLNRATLTSRTNTISRSTLSRWINSCLSWLQLQLRVHLSFLLNNRCRFLVFQYLRQRILGPQLCPELPSSQHLRDPSMPFSRIVMCCNRCNRSQGSDNERGVLHRHTN